jgi:hypothetical protein
MHDNSKQIKIIKAAFKTAEENGNPFPAELTQKSDDMLLRMIFTNFRSTGHGLRLSNHGFYLMRQAFEFITVDLHPDTWINNKQVLYLDRELESPFYLYLSRDKKQIYCFGRSDAMKIKLVGGDLDALSDIHGKKRKQNA